MKRPRREICFPSIGAEISDRISKTGATDEDLFISVGPFVRYHTKPNFDKYLERLRRGYIYGSETDSGMIWYDKKVAKLGRLLYFLQVDPADPLITQLKEIDIRFTYPPSLIPSAMLPPLRKKGLEITLCGCLAFYDEMKGIESKLSEIGYKVKLPELVPGTDYEHKSAQEGIRNIRERDLIRNHYRKIRKSDAILVVNNERKGIKNYIGGNTFLEMGFAYVLSKRIYVLQSLPQEVNYYEEMAAMDPIILEGDLTKI